LITMDVHMPGMDGFTATKEIMVAAPTPIIIVSSSSSGRDVELSLNALRAGALMVVPKPDEPGSPQFNGRQEHFLAMARAMADVKVVRRWGRAGVRDAATPTELVRPGRPGAVRLIAMAASTGGPAALQRILAELPADFPVPILVVQHIAQGFTEGLANWLAASCGLRVRVATDAEPPAPRTVFLAPDDRQLGVRQDQRLVVVDAPPVAGFRPSATFLFESVARGYGSDVAAVILTGMGSDGVAGLGAIRRAGGYVIAQDEATSVVYGMPAVAVEAGHADVVLPLGDIAGRLVHLARGADQRADRPDSPGRVDRA
ncbi:MAG: response regulator, partial [Gemmatimonadetes bacterium]|nr:response regulator [Gemmatimonadota bacterium]